MRARALARNSCGRGEWRVEGALAEKVRAWREEDARAREEDERRRMRRRWTGTGDEEMMDVRRKE